MPPYKPRRAITLAGGGPAAGLHIGVLLQLDEYNRSNNPDPIDFDVWALSCIGAWVGIIYHQCDPNELQKGTKARQTEAFFRDRIFRDDAGYANYPVNQAFGPDTLGYLRAWRDFVTNPASYEKLLLPSHMLESAFNWWRLFFDQRTLLSEADFNHWWHNNVLAVNPAVRFMMSLMYLSPMNGLTKIYYEDSSFLRSIGFDKLHNIKPHVYHNAWDLKNHRMQLFHNKPREIKPAGDTKYLQISEASLCACSALPFIEQTVTIKNETEKITYCEGALVDTVNFKDLIEDYPDLEEVWVVRIVDAQQVREPRNLADGLANLCMLFAGETGESDVKLFKQHMRKRRHWLPRIIEIPVSHNIDFQWNHSNLDQGIADGRDAMKRALERYERSKRPALVI